MSRRYIIVLLLSVVSFYTEISAQTVLDDKGGTYTLVTSLDQIDDDGVYLIACYNISGGKMAVMSSFRTNNFASYQFTQEFETLPTSITYNERVNTEQGDPFEYRITKNSNGTYSIMYINGKYIQNDRTSSNNYSSLADDINGDTKFSFAFNPATKNPYRLNIVNSPTSKGKEVGYLGANSSYAFSCFSNGTNLPTLYKKTSAKVAVSISSVGWASLYYGNYDLTVPEGVSAYTYVLADNGDGTSVLKPSHKYAAGDKIPANTGVIIHGNEGVYEFEMTAPDNELDRYPNVLKGCDTTLDLPSDPSSLYFMFSLNSTSDPGSEGFYYAANDGAAFTTAAHKVYLKLDKSANAKTMDVIYMSKDFSNFDNSTMTSVDHRLIQSRKDSQTYDINGRKIDVPTRGVFIRGGKKFYQGK